MCPPPTNYRSSGAPVYIICFGFLSCFLVIAGDINKDGDNSRNILSLFGLIAIRVFDFYLKEEKQNNNEMQYKQQAYFN